MKTAIFVLIANFLFVCASCQKQQSLATNVSSDSTLKTSTQTEEPQKLSKRCQTTRENTERDEIETSAGVIKVWTKTTHNQTDEIQIKDELYYQSARKEPVLITATKWDGYFKNICLSPNGKWATAYFYYEVRGLFNNVKTSEHPILINLENKDFLEWNDINKRTGKPDEGKSIYILGWDADKPAAISYKTTPEETLSLDLPDKLPTSPQSLYQATGYKER